MRNLSVRNVKYEIWLWGRENRSFTSGMIILARASLGEKPAGLLLLAIFNNNRSQRRALAPIRPRLDTPHDLNNSWKPCGDPFWQVGSQLFFTEGGIDVGSVR